MCLRFSWAWKCFPFRAWCTCKKRFIVLSEYDRETSFNILLWLKVTPPFCLWVLQAPAETAAHFPGSWCRGQLLSSSAASPPQLDFYGSAERTPCAGQCFRWMSETNMQKQFDLSVPHADFIKIGQPTMALIAECDGEWSHKTFKSSTFASSEAMWRHVRPLFSSCGSRKKRFCGFDQRLKLC